MMDRSVAGGIPTRPTISRTVVSGSSESTILPTPVQWQYTRRPTSVNIRIEWDDAACAT
ncbi:hypothetical protein ISCU110981_14305 [Isoptericola cucumis]